MAIRSLQETVVLVMEILPLVLSQAVFVADMSITINVMLPHNRWFLVADLFSPTKLQRFVRQVVATKRTLATCKVLSSIVVAGLSMAIAQ